MKIISIILMSLFMLGIVQNTYAHSSHSHSAKAIDMKQAEKLALGEVKRLIDEEKIDKSWANASLVGSEKDGSHWLSTFKNESLKEKNMLYVYVKSNGQDIKATFKK